MQDLLAWERVEREIASGALGGDLSAAEIADVRAAVRDERREAEAEVWASYRYLALFDPNAGDGLAEIDLGSGHAAAGETLTGRVIAALKSNSLLNESIGAGYIDRNWPPALLKGGAWPLSSLRQAFVSGALTRLIDPDAVLRARIREFVERGDFGLASSQQPDGRYSYVWFAEPVAEAEVAFEAGVFLLRKEKAQALKQAASAPREPAPPQPPAIPPEPGPGPAVVEVQPPLVDPVPGGGTVSPPATPRTLRIGGKLPADSWNRVGTKLIPKLRGAQGLDVQVQFTVQVSGANGANGANLRAEVLLVLEELGLAGALVVTEE